MKTMLKKISLLTLFAVIIALFLSPLKSSTSLAQAKRSKVILISFDGFMNEVLQLYLRDAFSTKGLGIIQKEGVIADGMKVALPSLTATSHISIATGATPGRHGVVSNTFHTVSDEITSGQNGFSAKISKQTPAIWEVAMQKGLTVGSIAFPGVDLQDERRTTDFGLAYTQGEYPSFAVHMKPEAFENHPHALPKQIKTFSIPLRSHVYLYEKTSEKIKTTSDQIHGYTTDVHHEGNERQIPYTLYTLDTTDDQEKNYDALLFDTDEDLNNGYLDIIDLKNKPWIELTFHSEGVFKGSLCRLVHIEKDLSKVTLYVGGLHRNTAFPGAFATRVEKEVGIWPGAPDKESEVLTTDMVLEQAITFSEYFKKVTLLSTKIYDYDLLLSYQPILDELQHAYFMIDPKQKDYSKEKSEKYLNVIHKGYLQANQVIHELMKSQKNSNLVIVSDHGMAPLHTVYFPNRVLVRRGFIEENANGQKTYYARSFSSGGVSHIYLNLEGRQKNGIVPQSQHEAMVKRLIEIFKDDPAIDFILTQKNAKDYGLDHTNSGDIILVGNPGYHLTDLETSGEITQQASFYGQHGYDPSLKLMKGIFAAWGPNISPEKTGEISYLDVFPFVSGLLK